MKKKQKIFLILSSFILILSTAIVWYLYSTNYQNRNLAAYSERKQIEIMGDPIELKRWRDNLWGDPIMERNREIVSMNKINVQVLSYTPCSDSPYSLDSQLKKTEIISDPVKLKGWKDNLLSDPIIERRGGEIISTQFNIRVHPSLSSSAQNIKNAVCQLNFKIWKNTNNNDNKSKPPNTTKESVDIGDITDSWWSANTHGLNREERDRLVREVSDKILNLPEGQYKIEINKPNNKTTPAISRAAAKGDLREIKKQLKQGVDINEKDQNGNTPLHLAARQHHLRVVKYLLRKGADTEIRNNNNQTTLHYVISRIRITIYYKAKPQYIIEKGQHQAIIEQLIKGNADIEARDNKGRTPLLATAYEIAPHTVKLLFDRGTDRFAVDNDGNDFLDLVKIGAKKWWEEQEVREAAENILEKVWHDP